MNMRYRSLPGVPDKVAVSLGSELFQFEELPGNGRHRLVIPSVRSAVHVPSQLRAIVLKTVEKARSRILDQLFERNARPVKLGLKRRLLLVRDMVCPMPPNAIGL